jgi:hypothetical protein
MSIFFLLLMLAAENIVHIQTNERRNVDTENVVLQNIES